MSQSKNTHAFNAFHPFKSGSIQTNQPINLQISQNSGHKTHKENDFSGKLSFLLGEKSALKIDYQEINRDLVSFGFKVQDINPQQCNPNLDKIRLKYSLQAMDLSFNDICTNISNTELSQQYFQEEVCTAFKILSRDYKNICQFFQKQLNDTNKVDLSKLEKKLMTHIQFYNHFSNIMSNYFEYITQD
ncbi:MAG: hypothetical protein ACJAQ0_000875 [Dasania sp.]|jgi:hypothetical protein